jgi:hypothetical protein
MAANAVVGSPAYFKPHPVPKEPRYLTGNACINQRMPTSGGPLRVGL